MLGEPGFDEAYCKANLLPRIIDRATRDEFCEYIAETGAALREKMDTLTQNRVVGTGGLLHTDACTHAFAAVFVYDAGRWKLEGYRKYPANGCCDGTARSGIAIAGVVERTPGGPAGIGDDPSMG